MVGVILISVCEVCPYRVETSLQTQITRQNKSKNREKYRKTGFTDILLLISGPRFFGGQ
jgi:hypothetical protein